MTLRTLLTIDEAAAAIGISKDTLRWHIKRGEVRFMTIGRGRQRVRRLFDPADLAAFVESRKTFAPQFARPRPRRRSSTTSGGEVIGFVELRARSPSGKLSK